MMSSSRKTAIPGLAAPPVLIFFHIPKAGGMTMEKVIERCLRDEQFNAYLKMPDTALLVRYTAKVADNFHKLPIERQHAVRCMVGTHFTFDVRYYFRQTIDVFYDCAPSGGSGCFQLLSLSGHEPPPMLTRLSRT